ncbi:uncharacterized protein LOC113506658 isoform X2 [Trichoplusia ni]|uniref:Uncharacterized protein LOC113506658 isoform X2 n=1 Tax=Trichoplusia ni TaxID=7111 RepID=A0A7E5WYM5_TRINI|nr:uncharacterized protein LOC113506658 isoform X2 [Trichoplusia ni]
MCVKCQKYLLLLRGLKIKRRTQIRTTLKKKAFEDAGIPLRQVSSTVTSPAPQAPHVPHVSHAPHVPHVVLPPPVPPAPLSVINTHSVLGNNAEVTLNMLNALETEIDVDGLGGDVKLEFEAPSEEVPTV